MPIVAPAWGWTATRGELAQLANVDEGVLSFWLRNNLLRPSPGRSGKGHHRRFDRLQVSIAAVLAELHRLGTNISALSSFSDILQRGATQAERLRPAPHVLRQACAVGKLLARFDAGETVLIYDFELPKDGPTRRRPAQSHLEIVEDYGSDYATNEDLIAVALSIDVEDLAATSFISDIIDEMDVVYPADVAWLAWQSGSGWNILSAMDGSSFDSDNVTGGFFIGVSAIIRRTWSLDQDQRRRLFEIERAEYLNKRALARNA